jgi:hypothetical protein
MKKGYVSVYTEDGKGKITVATGLSVQLPNRQKLLMRWSGWLPCAPMCQIVGNILRYYLHLFASRGEHSNGVFTIVL